MGKNSEYESSVDPSLSGELAMRHAEIEHLSQLLGTDMQRGTSIPALYNTFYKFIQNPSTVSVETFKRMVDTDDTVGSGVDFLTTCLAARIGRYQHPSDEITQFVNRALEGLEGGWTNNIKELLSASWAGYALSEKVWANKLEGFVPMKLVGLPPSTIMFETNSHGEITEDGILQYQRSLNPGIFNSIIGPSAISISSGFNDVYRPDIFAKFGDAPFPVRVANTYQYLSIRIPKLKCIHYSFDAQGKFGNPYGRSLLRRAYKHWVMKDAFLQMLSVALDRKGTPLTVVFADPNVTIKDPERVAQGNGKENLRGQRGIGIDAQTAAQKAFENIHNDSTIILPGKKGQVFDVEAISTDSKAEVFIAAIDLSNKSIMRALLIPSLIFTNGDGGGSYALGQEHARTFEKILDGWNSGLKYVLLHQLVREIIAYNFPKSAWTKDGFGDFSRRELSQDEREKEATMFATAIDKGVVDTNDLGDLNQMRESLGFEPRQTPIEKPEPVAPFGSLLDGPTDPFADGDANPFDSAPKPPFGKKPPGPPGAAKNPGGDQSANPFGG